MSEVLESLGERRIAGRIRDRLGVAGAGTGGAIEIGPGDDAAVVRVSGDRVVLTVDTQRDGVHFRREWISPEDLGRRALAVAVSDLAAMGARPVCALCSLVLPAGTDVAWFDRLLDGLAEGGEEFGCPVVGGDVSQPAPGVSLCMTAVGSLAPAERPARRDGARAGDRCVVVGAIGHAAAGRALLGEGVEEDDAAVRACLRAYRRPVPLVAVGRAIAPSAHALMDVSDGLSLDLARMCAASGVGARLEAAALVDAMLAAVAPRIGAAPERLALAGGDDYALLAAIPEESWEQVQRAAREHDQPVRSVGRFVQEAGLWLQGHDGVTVIEAAGWDPFDGGRP